MIYILEAGVGFVLVVIMKQHPLRRGLTSMTPSVLRLMSSELMLCVLLCNRLATSLTTFSLVFPTGGSSTPHVVFMTFLCKNKEVRWNTNASIWGWRTRAGYTTDATFRQWMQHRKLLANLWRVEEQLVKIFESGSHSLQDAVVDRERRM